MKEKLIICIVYIFFFCGCRGHVENDVIRKIENGCKGKVGSGCVIDLKKITAFDWEKMYLFPAWTSTDSIEKVIGIPYDKRDVEDSHSRILFVHRDKVIYEEDFVSLDYNNSTIAFQKKKSLFYTGKNYISSSDAVFNVVRTKIENSCRNCYFYSLQPLKLAN